MKKVSSNTIRTRIDALRKRMRSEGISLYMISDTDYHISDFQCDYFRALEYMSGFTGMNGMMVVTLENAHLWTDARYTEQAKNELAGTGIILHIDNNHDDTIRTIQQFFEASASAIVENIMENGYPDPKAQDKYVIAFDGRTMRFSLIDEIMQMMAFPYESGVVEFNARIDLISDVWTDRPDMTAERIQVLAPEYAGTPAHEKLADLRQELGMYGPKAAAIITALDDIAWLYNIRGNDIPYSVTTYAYAYVNMDEAFLFIDEGKVTGRIAEQLREEGIAIKHYDEFYSFLEQSDAEIAIVDPEKSNFASVITMDRPGGRVIISREGLIEERKAIKNASEAKAASLAGITDGVAMVKFMFWLERAVTGGSGFAGAGVSCGSGFAEAGVTGGMNAGGSVLVSDRNGFAGAGVSCGMNAGGSVSASDRNGFAKPGQITELDAVRKLWEFRAEGGAIKPSFPTVCAYGPNASIIHYEPSETQNSVIEPHGFLLVDSGAHYAGASTDITRTIPLGPLTHRERYAYTLLLASVLEFAAAVFPVGLTDAQLDVIAKQPLWRHGVDIVHSTGHGVGVNVQEGPQSIDWSKHSHPAPVKPGMITTCEPGLYYPGECGVRHENTYLCVERGGEFARFTDLTYVPIYTSALDLSLLSDECINEINLYHEKLRIIILPELEGDEIREWFMKITEPVARA